MALAALISCIGLILFLLWRDRARRPDLSWAVWIPTALLLIVGSRPVSMWLGASVGSGNDAERSPLDQLFYASVIGAALLVASMRHVRWRSVIAANGPLMALYLYFALSVLWSGDPSGSIKRLVKDFGQLFVIGVLWSEPHPLSAIRAVYFRCACILFPLSVVCDRYFPEIARSFTIEGQPMYSGVTTQKNTLGEMVLVFSLFLIWDLLEAHRAKLSLWRSWDRYFLLVLGLYLLRASQSKTALLCLLVAAFLLLRRGWLASRPISVAVLALALSLPYLTIFAQSFSAVISPLVESLGRNMTFTGRTEIWQHIGLQTVNPLIGAGYWNFWGGPGGAEISTAMKTPVPNAHCGYLDMYLDGGIVGLVILAILLIASGRRLIKRLGRPSFGRLRFAVLITLMIYNLSETTFARLSTSWFTALLAMTDFSVATAYLRPKRRRRRPSSKDGSVSPDGWRETGETALLHDQWAI